MLSAISCFAENVGVMPNYYFHLFIANIKAEEIIRMAKALMISEFSFCEIPIKEIANKTDCGEKHNDKLTISSSIAKVLIL